MSHLGKDTISPDMDINVLFEKSTIEEIQQIEKKTRADIEKKKDDLRLMVGQKYRDLIEAADTITDMKNGAENIMKSILRMQEMCQGLKSMPKVAKKPTHFYEKSSKQQDNKTFYGIATQIKVLQDMPEKMWSSLDSGLYLRATQLYLLSRHIQTNLQLEGQQSSSFLSRFSVLPTQWAAISHFKSTILQKSRETLKESSVPDQLTAECLSSILLLEDSTPRQVFNEFLLLRKNALERVFKSETGAQSIKEQVCEVVRTVTMTVHQIYSLFYQPREAATTTTSCNLFMTVIQHVTDQGQEGVIGCVNVKYLPENIVKFRPSLQHQAVPISTDNLKQNCQQWIHTCSQAVQKGMESLLSYVTSVKGLAAIRDQVWHILSQDDKQGTWEVECQEILGQPLAMWQDLLQPHFLARSQAILQSHFYEALDTCQLQIARVLVDLDDPKERYTEVEHDICNYIWMESPTDIPAQSAWVAVGSKTLADSGTLMMKARAYTPAIQSLCKNFDGKLSHLLEDVCYYLQQTEDDAASERLKEPDHQESKMAFDKFADSHLQQNFVQSSCQSCIHKLLGILKQQLEACQQQLKQQGTGDQRHITDRALLLGRLSGALCELTPHMHQCMTGCLNKPEAIKLVRKAGNRSKQAEHPKWTELKSHLQDFNQIALRVWSENLVDHLIRHFSGSLLNTSSHGVLLSTLRWDEVSIQEETEDGSTVKSTIRVPMQASWYIHTLLYNICADINRVGGHALNRGILQELVENISSKVVMAYEELLSTDKSRSAGNQVPLGQTRALQMLFDFKFLTSILPKPSNDQEAKTQQGRVEKVTESLEGLVDPFDLDVFMPYIQGHLSRQTQRCQVLYGAVLSLDRHGLYMSSKPLSTGQQEQHNIVPLSSCQSRFPLLPLSVQTRASMVAPIVQPPKPKISGPSLSNLPESQNVMESSMPASLFASWFS